MQTLSNSSIRTVLGAWIPVLVWAGVIFYLSAQPNLRFVEGPMDFWVRKTGHMGVFGILALLLLRAVHCTTQWPLRQKIGFAFFVTVLYAVSDEWHQSFVVGRHASAMDVLIDSIGTSLALFMKSW